MEIPLVDLNAQYHSIKAEIDQAIQRVIDHSSFILGEEVRRFERAFADYVGAKDAVGVSSGTAALNLALRAVGVGPGDEVITTPLTFFATAEAISQTGARPVFVDIDDRTYNLDVEKIESVITAKTKAILPVHLYGHPADMGALLDMARRHKIWLIEDAAQAHGAKYRGQYCGAIGHLACFSFFPAKNLGAYGDAGAVTGNDDSLLERVRKLRDHGRVTKYEHEEIGFGERLDGLHAAILRAKLSHLDSWIEARRKIAHDYGMLLSDCDVVLPYEAPDVRHAYHLYVLRVNRRDEVLAHLKSRGIAAGIHYPVPLHRQPAYLKAGYGVNSFPITERIVREILSLPMYPELGAAQIGFIAQSIKEVAGR